MKNISFTIVCLFLFLSGFSQEIIELTDRTIKIGGNSKEELYFGFTKGDKIIFNFEEIKGKPVKEIEVIKYPDNTIYSDFESTKIDDKIITVNETGIYKFKLKNTTIKGKICKVHIQREAVEGEKDFNSIVSWKTLVDTTWETKTRAVTAGYDTTYVTKYKTELLTSELKDEMIIEKSQKVHSSLNMDYPNKTTIPILLPLEEETKLYTKKLKAWAYWIGVGEESNEAWQKNLNAFTNIGGAIIDAQLGGTPLGSIMLGSVVELVTPKLGEDVEYWFLSDLNSNQAFMSEQQFMQFDNGKGIAAYGKFDRFPKDKFYIGLKNDNKIQGINVNIKISVLWEIKTFEEIEYQETITKPIINFKEYQEPSTSERKVPFLN